MKLRFLFLLCVVLMSCDDPSLQGPDDDSNEVIEPVPELRQLSDIQVAQNNATNIIRDIEFEYNVNDLLTTITETGTTDQVTTASYAGNNQLIQLSINESAQLLQDVAITYGNDDSITAVSIVVLTYLDDAGFTIEKTLFLDEQNRFEKVVTTQTDLSGVTTQVEDLRLSYSQNFNVTKIENRDEMNFIISSSEFTYNFNTNPFTDMNDIIRLFMFDEFVPYSRFLPATRLDYDFSSGSTVLERSIDYDYELDPDGYPMSRELTVTEGATTSTYFEFFNYRP